ncbi:asparaginase [Actinocatenispora rupis]|uniref:asparaginase n=1 Tax=Actinocatenispora rupis TaxID=519421 RepID=UPI001940A638|nr:asparaginase [Actinocatenispora rupis]
MAAELARVVRNGFVESVHYGHVVVLRGGAVAFAAGDPHLAMLPRSSLKPVQAVATLAAAPALAPVLTGERLAVACGSHTGEPFHLAAVDAILSSAGLSRADLRNVASWPEDESARDDEIRAGGTPAPVFMNCSGKHAAMLAACVANAWPTDSYLVPDHPVQRGVVDATERLTGVPAATVAIDGCGACCPSTTLAGLAHAFARIATGPDGSAEQAVAAAMRAHPEYVGGTGHVNTRFMQLVPGAIVKGGAEGVLVAATADGTAVAVKCLDGNPRATTAVALAALRAAGAGVPPLPDLEQLPVLGGGVPVGRILVTV